MLDSAIGKIIGAGTFAAAVFKIANENITIRKEISAVTVALPIVEIADIAVAKVFGFRAIDINGCALQRTLVIATEIDVAGLVEITAQTVEGVVLEIATINVAVEFAGCARLVDADAIMPHLVLVGRTGGLRKGRRGCAHAQERQGQ